MILVCAKCIHLPNVTPPDNPVSTSKDLAPPELNPDVSFYSLKTLQFHCWDANVFPPHQTFVGYSTWDVGYLGYCDGVAGLDEDICSSNANRSDLSTI